MRNWIEILEASVENGFDDEARDNARYAHERVVSGTIQKALEAAGMELREQGPGVVYDDTEKSAAVYPVGSVDLEHLMVMRQFATKVEISAMRGQLFIELTGIQMASNIRSIR